MLYFINRTYSGENWSHTTDSTTLLLNNSLFPYNYDQIVFPSNIIFTSASVKIQSYNLKFYNEGAPDLGSYNINLIGAGIIDGLIESVDNKSIKFKPYLSLGTTGHNIGAANALLSLSIIAQKS